MSTASPPAALPEFVRAFFQAMEAGDLVGLTEAFTEDALVNDQLCDHRGKRAIGEWAEHEVLGVGLRLEIVEWAEHYGSVIVTCHAKGQFDRRGLPDPLVLRLHFAQAAGRICLLIILQKLALGD